jgi:hypothetical protein
MMRAPSIIALLAAFGSTGISKSTPAPKALDVTAIVTDSNNNSALECWQLKTPFGTSTSAGTSGASTLQLGNLANATYTVLPPVFAGGVHNAPHPQYVTRIRAIQSY